MPTFPVDDIDPSVIFFGSSSAWGRYRENPAYNCTLTWLASGGTAKIFFIGSSIGVYGTNYANAPNRPACIYTIDEGTPFRLTSHPTTITKWGELFFRSPDLPRTSHVLTIKYDNDPKKKDPLVLDYFMVNDDTLPVSDLSSSLTTTSFLSSATTTPSTTPNTPVLSPSEFSSYSTAQSSSSFSTLESSSSSPTSGATPASGLATVLVQGKSESRLPIGPVIGGALGALTFICTVFLILYFRRRRREGHSDKTIGTPPLAIDSLVPEKPQIGPYNISQPPQHGGRGKSFVDTRSGMAESTTSNFMAGTVQRTTTQQTTAASSTSNMTIT